jgi:lysophospholipase L1-like esterase
MRIRAAYISIGALLAGILSIAAAPVPSSGPTGVGAGGLPGGTRGRGTTSLKFTEPADVPMPRTLIDVSWSNRHDSNLARAKQGNIDLYMLGDSITDIWGGTNVNGTGGQFAASWSEYIAGWNAANFGIGGDRTEQVLWRLKNGELDGVNPKVIVLLLGTNNLPASQFNYNPVPPEEAAKGYKAILDTIKEKAPNAKVLMVSVFPRADQEVDVINERVKKFNSLIQKFADGKQCVYLDIYDKFLGPDGRLLPGIMPDSLHPNGAGYAIWGRAMMPILTQWLGSPKPPATSN